jgi:hypothetical protein
LLRGATRDRACNKRLIRETVAKMKLPKIKLRGSLKPSKPFKPSKPLKRRQSKTGNPLENDPLLVELLDKLDIVNSYDGFENWRDNFLNRFEDFLGDYGSAKAEEAYSLFRKKVDKLVKSIAKVAHYVNDGNLSHSKVSTKARISLNEVMKSCNSVSVELKRVASTSSAEEKMSGYNKYHMGSVLVRDGFQEYERLNMCKDILQALAENVVNDVADKQILHSILYFGSSINQFTQLMEDLELYKILLKKRELKPPKPAKELMMAELKRDKAKDALNNKNKGVKSGKNYVTTNKPKSSPNSPNHYDGGDNNEMDASKSKKKDLTGQGSIHDERESYTDRDSVNTSSRHSKKGTLDLSDDEDEMTKQKSSRSHLSNPPESAPAGRSSTERFQGSDIAEKESKSPRKKSSKKQDDASNGVGKLSSGPRASNDTTSATYNCKLRKSGFSKEDAPKKMKGLVKFEPKKPHKLKKNGWTSIMAKHDDDDDKSVVSIASKNKAKKKLLQAKKGRNVEAKNNLRDKRDSLNKHRKLPDKSHFQPVQEDSGSGTSAEGQKSQSIESNGPSSLLTIDGSSRDINVGDAPTPREERRGAKTTKVVSPDGSENAIGTRSMSHDEDGSDSHSSEKISRRQSPLDRGGTQDPSKENLQSVQTRCSEGRLALHSSFDRTDSVGPTPPPRSVSSIVTIKPRVRSVPNRSSSDLTANRSRSTPLLVKEKFRPASGLDNYKSGLNHYRNSIAMSPAKKHPTAESTNSSSNESDDNSQGKDPSDHRSSAMLNSKIKKMQWPPPKPDQADATSRTSSSLSPTPSGTFKTPVKANLFGQGKDKRKSISGPQGGPGAKKLLPPGKKLWPRSLLGDCITERCEESEELTRASFPEEDDDTYDESHSLGDRSLEDPPDSAVTKVESPPPRTQEPEPPERPIGRIRSTSFCEAKSKPTRELVEEGQEWDRPSFARSPPSDVALVKGKEWSPSITKALATNDLDLIGKGKKWKRPTITESSAPAEDPDLIGKGGKWKIPEFTETLAPGKDQDWVGKGKEWRRPTKVPAPPANNRDFLGKAKDLRIQPPESASPSADSDLLGKGKEWNEPKDKSDARKPDETLMKPKSFKLADLVAEDDNDDAGVFADGSGFFLSNSPSGKEKKKLQFKPFRTWASPQDKDELSHPIKKPKDKKTRSAVTVKKTGRNKASQMKPQHADDASVVKIKKAKRKKGEVTYTKKTDTRRPKQTKEEYDPSAAMSSWLNPFEYQGLSKQASPAVVS